MRGGGGYSLAESSDSDTQSATVDTAPVSFTQYNSSQFFADASDTYTISPTTMMAQAAPTGTPAALADASSVDDFTWSFASHYVNEKGTYHATKTSDFSVRYQMEFRASSDLPSQSVFIRIPARLTDWRSEAGGGAIYPSDIAVPQATRDASGDLVSQESRTSLFNYYYEDDPATGERYIVFFNYKDIPTGTNSAWQVSYSNIDISKCVSGSTWSWTPRVSVSGSAEVSTRAMTGEIHCSSSLNSVSDSARYVTGKSYSPGLYTKNQVSSYAGSIAGTGFDANFDDYVFVMWRTSVSLDMSQPSDLMLSSSDALVLSAGIEEPIESHVVGWTFAPSERATPTLVNNSSWDTSGNTGTWSYYTEEQEQYDERYGYGSRDVTVVMAYPKFAFPDGKASGSRIKNTITATLSPRDEGDDQVKSATASWSYQDYDWDFGDPNGIYWARKYGPDYYNRSYAGWIDLLGSVSDDEQEKQALTDFSFSARASLKGYPVTHSISGGELGEYKQGTYYEVSMSDGIIAYPTNTRDKDANNYTNSQDYYNTETIGGASRKDDKFSSLVLRVQSGSGELGAKTGNTYELGPDDYYLSAVSVKRTDQAYDVWEDAVTSPVYGEGGVSDEVLVYGSIDGETYLEDPIYRFNWTTDTNNKAISVPQDALIQKDAHGDIRNIIAVKCVYRSTNYVTDISLDVSVHIKRTSPVFKELMALSEPGTQQIYEIVNTSEVTSQGYDSNGPTSSGVWDWWTSATATASSVAQTASSAKTVSIKNDAARGQVLADYVLTAYQGYRIYSQQAMAELRKNDPSAWMFHDLDDSGHGEWLWYDLLPYGMTLDTRVTPTAGRITTMNASADYQKYPASWNAQDVSVSVSSSDVQENWQGTGRTLVTFHISYNGVDPTEYSSYAGMWFEGYGISFRARSEWEDMDLLEAQSNIAAFTPKDESRSLIGGADIYKPGVVPSNSSIYSPFKGVDLRTGSAPKADAVGNVLYASRQISGTVPVATTDRITKTVRAGDNVFGDYAQSATVRLEGDYSYENTITTVNDLTDIIVFDRLEYAAADRSDRDTMSFHKGDSTTMADVWQGTLVGVDTTALTTVGISPVVYYHTGGVESAKIPDTSENRTDVGHMKVNSTDEIFTNILTEENGWYPQDAFEASGKDISQADAIAVDMRHTTSGGTYVLPAMEAVSFRIDMKAPAESGCEPGGTTPKRYAYNNSSYWSKTAQVDASGTYQFNESSSTRVELARDMGNITVEKVTDSAPAYKDGEEFEFKIVSRDDAIVDGESQKIPYSYREYTLQEKDAGGEWRDVEGMIRTTDADGAFTLESGQRAVFSDVTDTTSWDVIEEEYACWEPSYAESNGGSSASDRHITVSNKWHPLAYLAKSVANVDASKVSDTIFTYQASGIHPYSCSDGDFVYVVKKASTIGSNPQIVSKRLVEKSGDNYIIPLKQGEVLAIPLVDMDTNYTITEVFDRTLSGKVLSQFGDGASTARAEDWIVDDDAANIKVAQDKAPKEKGESISSVNRYRWKDLVVSKKVTHQDDSDIASVNATDGSKVTFKLSSIDGTASVSNKKWYVLDDDGDPTGNAGTTNENGELTVSGALGKSIKIEHLEANTEYVLSETSMGSDYEPADGMGEVSFKMPVYSSSKNVSLTNDYLYRPLTLTKQVIVAEDGATAQEQAEKLKDREFTFQVKIADEDGVLVPAGNLSYTIREHGSNIGGVKTTSEDGKLTLKNGQSAYFRYFAKLGVRYQITEEPDAEFPQVYPASEEDGVSAISYGEEMNHVFINGSGGRLLMQKNYVAGNDLARNNGFASAMNSNATTAAEFPASAHVTLYDDNGDEIKLSDDVTCQIMSSITADIVSDDDVEALGVNAQISSDGNVSLTPGYIYIVSSRVRGTTDADASVRDIHVASYEIAEDDKYDDGFAKPYENRWYVITSADKVASGSVDENPVATITNSVDVYTTGSLVEQRMVPTDDEPHGPQTVEENAKITYQVQRLTNGTWMPASGIPYVMWNNMFYSNDRYDVANGVKIPQSEDEYSYSVIGTDGKIIAHKSSDTYSYPAIQLLNEMATFNPANAKEGDLRIVQLPSETDAAWGSIAGYSDSTEYWHDLSATDKTVVYNDASYADVSVKKNIATEAGSDKSYTFVLKQVTGTNGELESSSYEPADYSEMDGILYEAQGNHEKANPSYIASETIGSGVSYQLYDGNGVHIGTYATASDGSFSLKPDQQARFSLPTQSQWTIEEKTDGASSLVDVSDDGNGKFSAYRLTKTDNNSTLSNKVLIKNSDASGHIAIAYYNANGGTYPDGASNKCEYYYVGDDGSQSLLSSDFGRHSGQTATQSTNNIPVKSGNVFNGWYDRENLANNATSGDSAIKTISDVDVSEGNVTRYAGYIFNGKTVKYAVSIYDIAADKIDSNNNGITDSDDPDDIAVLGKKLYAGLTFGPAVGGNYTGKGTNPVAEGYKNHTPTGVSSKDSSNDHRCIHDEESWGEIIKWASKDPYVYEQCLAEGCTRSVTIQIANDNPMAGSATTMTGDGAGILYSSINSNYRKWNMTARIMNTAGTYGWFTEDGWKASRIRSTLNGKEDGVTAESEATTNCNYKESSGMAVAGANLLTNENCLYSCFPQELQDGIVKKAVKGTLVYNSSNADDMATTYDKLWLFSLHEMGWTGSATSYNHKYEKNLRNDQSTYQKAVNWNTTGTDASRIAYNESGSAGNWWLRSPFYSSSCGVYVVNLGGGWSGNYAYSTGYGVSPGFCLGAYAPNE